MHINMVLNLAKTSEYVLGQCDYFLFFLIHLKLDQLLI